MTRKFTNNQKRITMDKKSWDFIIKNAKEYLKTIPTNQRDSGEHFNAFEISQVLAVVTGKSKEEIIMELVK